MPVFKQKHRRVYGAPLDTAGSKALKIATKSMLSRACRLASAMMNDSGHPDCNRHHLGDSEGMGGVNRGDHGNSTTRWEIGWPVGLANHRRASWCRTKSLLNVVLPWLDAAKTLNELRIHSLPVLFKNRHLIASYKNCPIVIVID